MVRVKSNKDGDIRRFVLPDDANYQLLREKLTSTYSETEFTIKYKDDEGDLVTISSDAELVEAITTAGDTNLLRLDVLARNGQRSATPVSHPFPGMPNVPGNGGRPMFPPPFAPPHLGHPGVPPAPMVHPPHPPHSAYPPRPYSQHPPARSGPATSALARAPEPAPGPAPAQSSQPATARAPPTTGSASEPSTTTSVPIGSTGASGGSTEPALQQNAGYGASDSAEFTPEQIVEGISRAFSGMLGSAAAGGMGGGVGSGGSFGGVGVGGRFIDGGSQGMRGRVRERGGGRGWRARRGADRGGFVRRDIPSEGPGSEWLRVLSLSEMDLGNFLRDFNPEELGSEFRGISENTMNQLRTLMAELVRSPGVMAVLSAVPIALPTLRGFLAELQAGVPITGERVDVLAVALSTSLSGILGAESAGRVAEFARTAARDEGVLALLRRVSGIGASWGGTAADAARDAGGDAAARVERAFQ